MLKNIATDKIMGCDSNLKAEFSEKIVSRFGEIVA